MIGGLVSSTVPPLAGYAELFSLYRPDVRARSTVSGDSMLR